MTLIVSAATRNFAIQVADTKLTLDGKFYKDDLVKTTIVRCLNAAFALSYIGLAVIDGKQTDKWVVDELLSSGATQKDIQYILDPLADALTNAIPRNYWLGRMGLTLKLVGMATGLQGESMPLSMTISNCCVPVPNRNKFDDVDPNGRRFAWYNLDLSSPHIRYYLDIAGAVGPDLSMINGLRKNIVKALESASALASPLSILESLVTMVRLQGKDVLNGYLIGRDCTGVIFKSDYSSQSYFRSDHPTKKRFPNIVRNGLAITNQRGSLVPP